MTTPLQAALDGLTKAFPPHPLVTDGAFREWGVTYPGVPDFVGGARGRTWAELNTRFLEYHYDAVWFLGPSSFVDYLPAYLAAVVRRDPALSNLRSAVLDVLTRPGSDEPAPDRFERRLATLTTEQREAVARALETLEASLDRPDQRLAVTKALDGYWRDFIREGDSQV